MRLSRFTGFQTLVFVLAFCLFAGSFAHADDVYGRVRGKVTDATGAVLPGVQVKIVDVATGTSRQAVTDADGNYQFLSLPAPARYRLTAAKPGFKTTTATDVSLNVNQVFVSNLSMDVGTATETVEVQANAAQVDATTIQLGATITSSQITNLPLNGRNWVQLQQTLPGVVNSSDRFGSNYSTNGSQTQQNSYLINGTDYNDLPLNSPLTPPSPDSIAEVHMVTNTMNPEFGRNSGAIMNAVTKSGTNHFHGSAFEFYRDTFLNTRSYFQSSPSVFHQNQFGGTLGGPIIKNKTFAFFSYQGTYNRTSQSFSIPTVFTASQLGGNWSSAALSGNTSPFPLVGSDGNTYPAGTPYTTLFPTGQVPVADFSTVSMNLVKAYVPLPNFKGTQYSFNPTASLKGNQFIGRFDQTISQHDAAWFYALVEDSKSPETLPFTGSTLPGFGDQSIRATKQFTAAWNHTFSGSMLNELRLGYTRFNFAAVIPQKISKPADYGFPDILPQNPISGAPRINITGYFNLGFSSNGPQPRKDQTYQIDDNFSVVHGRHNFKTGFSGRLMEVWNPFAAANNGSYSFGASGGYSTGDAGLDFLLGIPDSYSQNAGGLILANAKEAYFYFQDQWQVKDNFTVTYGTGYQVDTPIAETQYHGISRACVIPGEQSKIYPSAPVGMVYPGDPGCNTAGGATIKWDHLGPRIGFNYAPGWGGSLTGGPGKTSIHGGFGLYYNRSEEELSLQDLGTPPLGLGTGGVADATTSTLTLSPGYPNPWMDISCSRGGTCPANLQIANKFPFSPPPAGSSPNFSIFEPLSINTLSPDATEPYSENWNLTVERELPARMIMKVAYVGAHAGHLITAYDRIVPTPAGVAACAADPNCVKNHLTQNLKYPSHYASNLDPTIFGGVGTEYNHGWSNYNALQITVDKHLSRGLQFLSTYTWSHSLDTGSSYEDTAFNGGSFDPYGRLSRDYASSTFDARHRWAFSFSYEIPNLNKIRGLGFLPDQLFGGWGLTGINILQSGFPFLLSDSKGNSLVCTNWTYYACADRPDLVKTPVLLDPHTATFNGKTGYWFDPASFTHNAVGTLGTAGRNSVRGPGFWNTDFAVHKDTHITESKILELRLEAFNLLNHTNWGNPIGNRNSSNFGRITSTKGNSRLIQLGARFEF